MSTEVKPTVLDLRAKLREHFGFKKFRPGQAEAMRAAVEGRDTLVIMPTGSGKSLCYQLPGLMMTGATVIVSPLISLMKDQADGLRERDLRVAQMNSTLTPSEEREEAVAIAAGQREFIYTTPERMADPDFRALLKKQPVGLFVVDEAHCVSHWGHDFRPDYLSLGAAIEDLGSPPVLALTATATQDVIDDIVQQLRIPDAEIVHTGFYRSNLHLSALQTPGDGAKRQMLLQLLHAGANAIPPRPQGSGIIYAATVRAVEDLVLFLNEQGIQATGYHGRLSTKKREATQDQFMNGHTPVMVATNAFGLGIDKADIRFILHYHLPGTLEAYYQECGRAGRDGNPAWCTLLYDPADAKLHKFFQGRRYPDDGDLVNAHHTLTRFADRPKGASLDELAAVAPLPKGRLKVCLDLLSNRKIVALRGRRWHLIKADQTREELARAGQAYQDRQERDKIKQKQMMGFVEGSDCRWQTVLSYFDGEELPQGRCGHCDNCAARGIGAAG